MWIAEGEKYALVGLQVGLDGRPPPERVAPHLWALTSTTFEVPRHWREWLGSIRADQVVNSNLFLVAKLKSERPGVLDAENRSLQQRVERFYGGLLLSAMFSPSHRPFMLTGARSAGTIDVRQHSDLDLPAPQVFRPYPAIVANDVVLAAQLAQKLNAMVRKSERGGLWRLFRTLNTYVRTRTLREPLDRIHQYCRCIEGLILPDIGRTKQQFKSRTELFIGPRHHELMGALYDIRSDVEHLHENRYLEAFDRRIRLDLVKKEAIVEHIARTALARVSSQDRLWRYFGNTAALGRFWALSSDERREVWGDPIDPMVALRGFAASHLSDEMLGAQGM